MEKVVVLSFNFEILNSLIDNFFPFRWTLKKNDNVSTASYSRLGFKITAFSKIIYLMNKARWCVSAFEGVTSLRKWVLTASQPYQD